MTILVATDLKDRIKKLGFFFVFSCSYKTINKIKTILLLFAFAFIVYS